MDEVTVEEIWKRFWAPIVVKDGEVDLEQVKKELFDYYNLMEQVTEVYCNVTGGRISKPNTLAEDVIAETSACYAEVYREE